MINLGDITKISGYNAPTVDVVIGGSPCQDLSIAGKRAGLAGERSGLYMEQIRIIKEMREHDLSNGRSAEFIRPRYMVWENVPGAFSSNHGKDFASVLEEAVRVIEPEAPPVPVPEKGWPTSGCLMGDGWSVAWRVLDAQFWGVPQRRRRIALVADFGGQSAPEILFIRKSMSGDSETGRDKGKGTAGDAENGVRAAVDGVECLTQWDCQSKRVFDPSGSMSTYQAMGDGGANNVAVCYSFDALASNSMKSENQHSGCREVEVSKTLDTTDPNPSKNQGGIAIVQPTLCMNDQRGSVMSVSEDVEYTLREHEHGDQSAVIGFTNRGVSCEKADTLLAGSHGEIPMVGSFKLGNGEKAHSIGWQIEKATTLNAESGGDKPAICIQGNCIDRADTAGCNGKGWRDDDVSFTLNTIDRPAVYSMSSKQRSPTVTQDVSNTNCANDYKEPQVVCDFRGNGDGKTEPTLAGDHQNRVTDYTAVCIPVNTMIATRHNALGERTGLGIGKDGDAAYTISSAHEHAVYMSMQAIGEYRESDVSSSCKQRDYKDATDLICAVDCRNGTENPDINGTLQSKPNGGMSLNLQNVVRKCSIVRRLTPLECERLQGFPDGWTDIGDWVDSKGKKRQTTDSARYKALGNSIALPPWKWVLKRLSAQYERDATMASLFDGIGGFPLIWEQLNGRGSCLWTSEIDEFPIAVTRQRFREEQ